MEKEKKRKMKLFSLNTLKIPNIINLEYTRKDLVSQRYEQNEDYIVEENKDGFRCIFILKDDKISMFKVSSKEIESRNIFNKFPQFKTNKINKLLVLDGFISGIHIELLTKIVNGSKYINNQENDKAVFYCFDVLVANAKNLRDLTYIKRRAILFYVVKFLDNKYIKLIKASKNKKDFYNEMVKKNRAGVVYKNIKETYSTTWFKRACVSFIYAQIRDISENCQSITYGLKNERNEIVEYGKVTNKRQDIVKQLKDMGQEAIGRIIKIQFQYITLNHKLRNSRVIEICDNNKIEVEKIKNLKNKGEVDESN